MQNLPDLPTMQNGHQPGDTKQAKRPRVAKPPVTDTFNIRALTATLDLPLYPRQIPHFRAAIAELAGWENDLFHNHKPEGNERHFRYPLIQYRVRQGKAGIIGLQEGADALQGFMLKGHQQLKMGNRTYPFTITHLKRREHTLRLSDSPISYNLYKWLPLNKENYAKWQSCRNYSERVALLESILSSHLIGFCFHMGWRTPDRVKGTIQYIQMMQQVKVFNVPMLSFNLTYTANIELPPHIGLGKAISHGFGWQVPAGLTFGDNGFEK